MPPTFAQLGVPESISRSLAARGITEPFAIQAAAIVDALAGRDVCGRAPTGSGKTLAFGIPLVASVDRAGPRRPRGLVLAPTRELAEQICSELRTFAGRVRIAVVYGGVGYGPQLKALREGVDVLVACPGRLEDLLGQEELRLDDVDRVVIDEADRLADMGFMPAVRRILDQTATARQTMLFSATLDNDVAKLTRDYQVDPVRHEIGEETPDITAATHLFWTVDRSDRVGLTAEAVGAAWPAIIFCRTRHGADRLAKQLARTDIRAAAIHGGRSQKQRTRALTDFTDGKVHALVATDVAARGIHVDGVASVLHYDPPEDHKAYVHRSGRTARAGRDGVVISLVQPDQKKGVRRLQRDVGIDEPVRTPDLDTVRELSPPRISAPAPRPSAPEGNQSHRTGATQTNQTGNGRSRQSANRRHNRSHKGKRGGPSSGGGRPAGSTRRSDGSKERNGQPGGNRRKNARKTGAGRPGAASRNGRSNRSRRSNG